MTKDLELTKTIANIITINAQAQATKLSTTVDQLYTPNEILELAKLIQSSSINNQGLTTALEELAKNFEPNLEPNAEAMNNAEEDPFGSFEEEEMLAVESPKITLAEIIKKFNLIQTTDKDALGIIVDSVIGEFSSQAGEYKSGKVQIIGFLVGQCMKQSEGQGNPKIFNELLATKLQ
jgi:Asp-tRNA(Asn)/Glu-tRNA(Gln) amidotransferase B subunit